MQIGIPLSRLTTRSFPLNLCQRSSRIMAGAVERNRAMKRLQILPGTSRNLPFCILRFHAISSGQLVKPYFDSHLIDHDSWDWYSPGSYPLFTIEYNHLTIHHVFHTVLNTSYAIPGMTKACKRHPIRTEGRMVIYYYRSCADMFSNVEGYINIIGEDRSLKSIWDAIGFFDSCIKIGVPIYAGNRSEYFLRRSSYVLGRL